MADSARSAGRTKKLLVGGLVTLAAVAVALALIFTVGGQGPKDKAAPAPAPATTSSLADSTADASPATPAVTPAKTPAATTPATTPAKTPATTPVTTPVTTPAGSSSGALTPGLSDIFTGNKISSLGDPLQAAAALGLDKQEMAGYVAGSGNCWVMTADDLTAAVADDSCPTIYLGSNDVGAYALSDELVITRSVTIIGHPRTMPMIDGSGTTRAIHVMSGGYLDLRFVRVKQGGGTVADRVFLQGLNSNSKVATIYGGSILFDQGAVGGNIRGVIFLAVANTAASVINAITSTVNFVGGRILGGHVAMITGVVNFVMCTFWDTTLLLPFTDQITLGGDVLVLGGAANFIGCLWFATLLIGSFGGAGFNVGVFGGTAIFTGCVVNSQGAMQSTNGAGQLFLVGGGVMVIAGMDFRLVTGGLFFTGIGDWFVGGGVMILTGFTIENAYALLVALGAGFYTAVGAGVLVQAGVTYTQFNGPNFQTLSGASIYQGAGNGHHTGVASSFYQTVGFFAGPGAYAYSNGYAHWVGCPLAVFAAVYTFYGVGIAWAHMTGFLVFIGNPSFAPLAVTYAAGQGSVLWLGAGAGVVGYNPVYAPAPADTIFANAGPGLAIDNFVVNGVAMGTNTGGNFDGAGLGGQVGDGAPIIVYSTNETEPVDVAQLLANPEQLSLTDVVVLQHLTMTYVDGVESFSMGDAMASTIEAMGGGLRKLVDVNKRVRERRALREVQQQKVEVEEGRQLQSLGHLIAVGPYQQSISGFGLDGVPNAKLVMACDNSEPVNGPVEGSPGIVDSASCADIQDELDKLAAYREVKDESSVKYGDYLVTQFKLFMEQEPGSETVPNGVVNDAFKSIIGKTGTESTMISAISNILQSAYTRRHIFRHLGAADGVMGSAAPAGAAAAVDEHYYDVSVVNTAAATAEALRKSLGNDAAESSFAGVLDGVKDYINTAVGSDVVKALSIEYTGQSLKIPSYDTSEFRDFVNRAASGSSLQADVELLDSTGAPLKQAVPGDKLQAVITNFPAGTSQVALQLIGSDAGATGIKQTVVNVGDKAALDSKGAATISFTVPAGTKTGDYYLIAYDSGNKANIAMTPTFPVVNTPAPKRRLGPRMYF